jgi:hypothetical protein
MRDLHVHHSIVIAFACLHRGASHGRSNRSVGDIGRALAPHHLAVVGKFAMVGPGIGVLVVLLFTLLEPGSTPGSFFFVMILFGYLLGVVPAALAGMIYTAAWGTRSRFPRLNMLEFGALLGAITGLIAFSVFTAFAMSRGVPDDLKVYLLPLFAGAVCGAMVAREREQGEPDQALRGHRRGE